jgi:mono/diheme cytochrome c family protein
MEVVMSRWWRVVLLVGLVALVALPLGAIVRGGISARPDPGAAEVAVARWLRSALIPAGAKSARNPLASSPRLLADGRAHFADHCASCHGNDGSGDTPLGRNMYPRAPDMRGEATQGLTDGELFYIIENGIRLTGMPAWGGAGKPEESWKLVLFIRHLPTITPEEVSEMEKLNPRSLEEWKELQEEFEFLEGKGTAPAPRVHGAH